MIDVRCVCGKSFKAPDSRAGAKGQCPACGIALAVPRPAVRPPAPAAAPPRAAAQPESTAPARVCPSCKKLYGPKVVICFPCGIDLRTGRALPPEEDAGAPVPPVATGFLELDRGGEDVPLAELEDVECPRCRSRYAIETVLCGPCGINMLTGEAIPVSDRMILDTAAPTGQLKLNLPPPSETPTGDDPDPPASRLRKPKERRGAAIVTVQQPDEKGFARIVLDMYVRPVTTMESLTFYLSSWPMLTKMAIFYVGSLAVIFLNAWLDPERALGGGRSKTEVAVQGDVFGTGFKETERFPGDFMLNIWVEPKYPKAGEKTRIVCQVFDNLQGKEMKGKISATIYYRDADAQFGSGPAPGSGVPGGVDGPPGEIVASELFFEKGKAPEEYYLEQKFKDGGEYIVRMNIIPEPPSDPNVDAAREPAEYEYEFLVQGYARRKGPTAIGFMVALSVVVQSVIGMLITVACVNVGGRIIGGGGSFLAMLVVLAFLTGVVNYTEVLIVVISPTLGASAVMVAGFVFKFWRLALYFLALMKVYDVDFMFALAISFFASLIQWWAAFSIMMGVYDLLT